MTSETNETMSRSNHQLEVFEINHPTHQVGLFVSATSYPPTMGLIIWFKSATPHGVTATAYHRGVQHPIPKDAILIVVVNLFLEKRIYV